MPQVGGDARADGGTELDHVVVVTTTEEGELDYVLTIEGGEVRKAGKQPLAAEQNDSITEVEDGVWEIDGYTGNEGYGDTFEYNGRITDFEAVEQEASFTVEVDGEEVGTDFPIDDPDGEDPDPEPEPDDTFTVTLTVGDEEIEADASLAETDGGYAIDVDVPDGALDLSPPTFEGEFTMSLTIGGQEVETDVTLTEEEDGYAVELSTPDDFDFGAPSDLATEVEANKAELKTLRKQVEDLTGRADSMAEDVEASKSFISKFKGLFS